MILKTFALSTGSSGNCYYIENSNNEKILIDFGLSYRKTKILLRERGINISDISGIFITHEHTDHIKGIKILLKKENIPIYATEKTAKAINLKNFNKIEKNKLLKFQNFKIYAIEKKHDAIDPVSYIIEHQNKKIGIFTDLGLLTKPIKEMIKKLDIVYLETNYSIAKLTFEKSSFYINRCISELGHLETEEVLEFVTNEFNENQIVIFSHISENNNDYNYIDITFQELLNKKNKKIEYFISYQREPTPTITLKDNVKEQKIICKYQ